MLKYEEMVEAVKQKLHPKDEAEEAQIFPRNTLAAVLEQPLRGTLFEVFQKASIRR